MKKGILLNVQADDNWIGGVYYIRNIAFQLLQNKRIMQQYGIYCCVNEKYKDIFSSLSSDINIFFFQNKKKKILILIYLLITKRIRYVFPFGEKRILPWVEGIGWIADFQRKCLPQMYKDEYEIKEWSENINKKIREKQKIVVSSQDSYNDFFSYYKPCVGCVFIIRFVSYIVPELKHIHEIDENKVLSKYGFEGKKYACIINQFWKHKNHLVVFEAIKKLVSNGLINDYQFVCTGNLYDERNIEHIKKIREYFDDSIFHNILINLGFLDRVEQLIIMKNADFIIQPSLFEGWGTVLEECKVLDKDVILSNIPIHVEQKNDKCILFDPYDVDDLAQIIYKETKTEHYSNIEKGISKMYDDAIKYSKDFEKVFKISKQRRLNI